MGTVNGSDYVQTVRQVGDVVGLSAGVDRSATLSTTSAQIMAANPLRKRLYIANDSAIDVWIRPASPATAVAGGGNIRLAANGGFFELAGSVEAWHAIAVSGTPAITAREF